MKSVWSILAMMSALLVLTAAITVASRMWMLETHRELRQEEDRQVQLLDQEHALQVEWVSRTDMNTVERRARKELGMVPLRADQWRKLEP